MSTTHQIVLAAIITEGLLVITSYIFAGLFELRITWETSYSSIVIGVLAAAPLLAANHLLWRLCIAYPESTFARFSRYVVLPLCKAVSAPTALLLATLAGFGEELFFRGVLNELATQYLGWIMAALVTSTLFAYVHFIGSVKKYAAMLPIYIAVGIYLWSLYTVTGSLVAVMVTHAVYNFFAILIARGV